MPRHTAPLPSAQPVTSETPPALPIEAAAAHDIANLVDAAIRSVSLARRSSDPQRHLAATEAALEQVGDLLAVLAPRRARLESVSSQSIYAATRHATDLLFAAAQEHGIALRAEIDPALHSYAAAGLFRVLADAIRNAIESISVACCVSAASPPGEIVVAASVHPEYMEITVTDNGAGPPDSLGDPFDLGASSKPGSRGLGLAVAAHVVRRLRGVIALERAPHPQPARPGAVLRMTIPLQSLVRIPTTQ